MVYGNRLMYIEFIRLYRNATPVKLPQIFRIPCGIIQ